MTEESSPVKKGRGRPRKSDTPSKPTNEKKKPVKETEEIPSDSVDETTETEEDAPLTPPSAKKKRPAAEAQEANDKNAPPPKRGRGRPPKPNKVVKPPVNGGRGRGRPRKNP